MDSGPIRESIEQVAERLWSAGSRDGGGVTVEPLDRADVTAVSSVLADASRSDPFARAVFDDGDDGDGRPREALASVLAARLRVALGHNQPAFVARDGDGEDGDVVGGAALSRPGFRPPRRATARAILDESRSALRVLRAASLRRARRMRRVRATPSELPDATYTLECFGVHPDRQGEGIGSRLLEAVHEFTSDDPGSEGVYHVTAAEATRAVCVQQGYETVEITVDDHFEFDGEPLRAFHMHRSPDP